MIETVNSLEDDLIMQGLHNNIELEKDADSIYEFDHSQLLCIEEANLQVKEGKTQTDDEVNTEIEEWLNK